MRFKPHVLGHRGAVLPEGTVFQNSIPAFKLALEHTEGFETDACLSSDSEVFLIHEEYGTFRKGLAPYLNAESLKKTAGRRLDEMQASEIKELKLICGSPIPTLGEAIDLIASYEGKTINIELKGYDVFPAVHQQLEDAFALGKLTPKQVIVSSFDHAAMVEVRKTNPQFKVGALFVDKRHAKNKIYPHTDSKSCYTPIKPAALKTSIITEIDPDYIIIPHIAASVEVCAAVAQMASETKLAVWVVSERGDRNPLAFLQKLAGQPHSEVLDTIIVDDPQDQVLAEL